VDHVLGPGGQHGPRHAHDPREEVDRGTDGISLFIVDMDSPGIDVSPIPKHGINYSKSCRGLLRGRRVPEENLLGEGRRRVVGARRHAQPERIGFAAAGTGIGKLAADTAIQYANDRGVRRPDRQPSGRLVPDHEGLRADGDGGDDARKAAWLYDQGEECGYETNVAKATAVSAGIEAVKQSMQAFGGWGYAKNYDVERWWREINLTRLAPVSQQMAYNHISQELGFPKSY